jgi:hypothetical protein
MPQNIVVGAEAQAVAEFLAKYSGLQAPKVPVIENTAIPGAPAEGTSTTESTSTAPAASVSTSASAATSAASNGKHAAK